MTDIDIAVARLRQARAGQPAPSAPELSDADAAYAAQAQLARELGWFDDGPPRFWKSGGPSREAVAFHAALPPAGVWASPADASAWPFTLRGIEAEIALRLGEPVDAARAATLDLVFALGHVVDHAIAGHMFECLFFGHITGFFADHDAEFDFPIGFF